MPAPTLFRRALTMLCMSLLALGLAACGTAVSTSSFKGEEHEAAQAVANLQADATASEQSKVCDRDLAAGVVSRLGGSKGCQQAIKTQLTEIDNLELSVRSVRVNAPAGTATAIVKSTVSGKKVENTVSLVKEGGKWKVAGLG
jgi:hypothetical protein